MVALVILIYWIFKLLIGPIAEHAFAVKAINKMCMIRTTDQSMIDSVCKKEKAPESTKHGSTRTS